MIFFSFERSEVLGNAPKYITGLASLKFSLFLKHYIQDARQACMDFRRISVISVRFYSFAA